MSGPAATDPATPSELFTDSRRWGDIDAWEAAALELHERGGIHRIEAPGYAPFWAVIDHAAVLDVERRAAVFNNAPRPVLSTLAQDAARQRELKALIHMDGHEHATHRSLTADWFKPASIGRMTARLDELSARVVQRLDELGGTCDWVPEAALPYPLQVILEVLGLPDTDYPRMLRLTQELFGQEDPDLQREPSSPEAREKVVEDFFTYFRALASDRRAAPTDDLATVIANGVVDGQPIRELPMLGYYVIVATAGHDTTSSALAGGMHLLATHPEVLARLRDEPGLLPNAVEEMLRRTAPVRHFMRTVAEPTVVAGQELAPGERLYLSYKAANLDPKVFPDPQRFDVTRPNASKQLSFGHGAHFCLGAQLARNEMRSLFGAVVPRLESLELAGPATMARSTFVGGHKSVPISYRLSSSI
jgi:cytochrome P450